ncbi:D-2-hydroxyacid dehydrogenase [Vibrio sp. TH_r3]|uniref:D-2-hydroxyacid dehydrogenase n=1 Tax=Vibrio sp. TH_r3 TaxID=3082084 RepID=UPI002954C037|nr:D-2-hydroxyacid dehydrogenase [Vibrio sp. TH_r3]MDV7105520.1 D-2-hydroxyacid dehydrogenase [Vibrio sp. TH_r3]
MKTIVCLDGYTLNPGDNSWAPVEALGNFICYDRSTDSTQQVIERAQAANIVLTNKTPITREIIDTCPKIECIAVLATGYNVVDVEYAKSKGIPVMNVPVYGTDTVAEMVFAHIMHLVRNVAANSDDVQNNLGWTNNDDWTYWLNTQIELSGKTIGIIGFGNIGQRVGEIAAAFKMKVVAHDAYVQKFPDYTHSMLDLDKVLEQADFVSLHCPALPNTINFMNRDKFILMKNEAFLINTSRGQLVVEQDLADALNTGEIAGAALDTLWQEPPSASNPLLSAKNCTITPHLAWATLDARRRITAMVADNIRSFLEGNPKNTV